LKKKASPIKVYSVFDTPVDTPIDQVRAERVFRRKQDFAAKLGLPPVMAHHAARYGSSYDGIKKIHEQFMRGCALTGKPLLDKCRSGDKDAQPFSTIVRPDGTFISNIMWGLSRKGKISDAALLAVARAMVAHNLNAQKPQPTAPAPLVTQPPPPTTFTETPQYGSRPEPHYVNLGPSGVGHEDADFSDYVTAAAECRKRGGAWGQ
jgi:hypothetical protein